MNGESAAEGNGDEYKVKNEKCKVQIDERAVILHFTLCTLHLALIRSAAAESRCVTAQDTRFARLAPGP